MKNRILLTIKSVVVTILLFAASSYLNAQSVQDMLLKKPYSVEFKQSRSNEMLLTFTLDDYDFSVVEKDGMTFTEIDFNHGAVTDKAGFSELPIINANLMLDTHNDVNVTVEVVDYIDIQLDHPLLPSRGTIYRNQDPSKIPFVIAPESIKDEFYPSEIAFNEEPFVLRDVRGVNIYAHPFRYNAEKSILRVYKTLVVTVHEDTNKSTNPLTIVPDYVVPSMSSVYESLFINYTPEKFANEIGEHGEMLVIYTSRDVDAIQPYITWKKEKGYVVHTQEVATGTNVKNTIQNAYNANPNIFYVQLVGGWADIQTDTENLSGNTTAPKDPMLGCVVGTDLYPDIIIGRFSARTTANVTTHVNKAIDYMMSPDTGGAGDWYKNAVGMARNEGDGGGHHGGEADYVHMDIVRDKLLSYNYTTVYREYDGNVPGVTNTTAAQISSRINDGISVLNFCNHGYETGWSVGSYSNTHVNALTNGNKLPFIWSVACLVGKFNYSSDCFAETWLNKSGGGAVAFLGSTINQPWQPPMTGQDYFNDLLIGGYNYDTGDGGDGNSTNTTIDNKRTTFGALSFNGMILMLSDSYGTASYQETMKTWTLFGDASLQVRTDTPVNMAISHDPDVMIGSASFDVTCDTDGAWGTLTRDGELIGTAFAAGGTINIPINEEVMVGDILKLVVTAYNKVPYVTNLNVIAAGAYANFVGDPTNILLGETVTFTDTSDPDGGSFSAWSWNFGAGADPATATGQGPHTVTYNTAGTKTVSLTVTHSTDGNLERIKENYITVNDIFTLTVNFNGNGSVMVDGVPYVGPMSLAEGSTYSLEAVPADFWHFNGWTGDLVSYNNPVNLLMNGNKTVTINFLDCSSVGIPFEENFDASTEMPLCWDIVDHQGNGQVWQFGTHASGLGGTTGNYAFLNSDAYGNGNSQNTDLVSPAFDFTNYTDVTLSFTHYYMHYTAETATVSYSVDNGTSWTQIQQWAATTANPATFNQVIPALAGQSQVMFKWNYTGTWGYYWDVDDIAITGTLAGTFANFSASPTTVFPGQTVSFTDASSGDATSWAWDFGADATPATATGQGPHAVTYSTLGNKTVSLTVNGEFTETKVDYISVVEEVTYPTTFYENWQDYTDFTIDLSLNGWTTIDVLNEPTFGSTDYDFPGEGDPFAYMAWNPSQTVPAADVDHPPVDGDKYAISVQTTGGVVDDKWLISPKLTGTATSSLSFYAKSITDQYGLERFRVLISTTDTNMGSFTQINAGDYLEAPVAWTLFEFDLAPHVDGELYHFAFQRVSDDAFIMMLDAINVDAAADFLLGDINQDGFLNVLDVVLMVNLIMNNEFDPIGDMNGDGVIDAVDLTMLIDIIMAGAKTVEEVDSEPAFISIEDGNIIFESDGTLNALQFELTADNAADIVLEMAEDKYNFSYAADGNIIRGLVYSLDNSILPEETVKLLTVKNADNSLRWGNVFAVNTAYDRVEVITKDATGINDIDFSNLNIDLFPNPNKGKFTVAVDLPKDALIDMRLYDATGREVMNIPSEFLLKGSNQIEVNMETKLNSGFYILKLTGFDANGNKLLFTKERKVLIEN